jgi:hypothetical protein
VLIAVCLCLAGAGSASAGLPPAHIDSVGLPLTVPASQTTPPPGFTTTARDAVRIAFATKKVRELRGKHPNLNGHAYIWAGRQWEVDLGVNGKDLAEVDVSASGKVLHVWTGVQADAYFARGHFGRLFDSPWVFIPFCVLFVLPFVDPRRPFRLLHLDLLVLLSFAVSYFLFTAGKFTEAVPLAYPPLLYLLVRMLVAGVRGRRSSAKLVPLLPTSVLAAGAFVLTGARLALGFASGSPIDVGYASVVGADRIWHHLVLYVNHSAHGDTYGPITYLSYLPFERLWPWHGQWDYLPAAHAAATTFDLLTIVGLFLLARRLRPGRAGTRLGFALMWAWAAFPFTLLGLMKSTNDGLVAMLLVYTLLAFASPAGRGALLALGAAAKFFPAAMLPLFAMGPGERNWRRPATCIGVFVAVVAFAVWMYLPPEGLGKFYDATIGFQLHRHDLFSPWGLDHALGWLQSLAKAVAILVALAVAIVPRRRTVVQASALGAAVAIAIQLPSVHWFYFYIAWFAPMALFALLAAYRTGPERETADEDDLAELTLVAPSGQRLPA